MGIDVVDVGPGVVVTAVVEVDIVVNDPPDVAADWPPSPLPQAVAPSSTSTTTTAALARMRTA
jgi:hypothetical protein